VLSRAEIVAREWDIVTAGSGFHVDVGATLREAWKCLSSLVRWAVLVPCSFSPGQSQEGQGAHRMERKLRVQKFSIPDPTFFFNGGPGV
jgi:hypothetical protein